VCAGTWRPESMLNLVENPGVGIHPVRRYAGRGYFGSKAHRFSSYRLSRPPDYRTSALSPDRLGEDMRENRHRHVDEAPN
jgi:hypothetical protein